MSMCKHPTGNVLITKDHFILGKGNYFIGIELHKIPQIPGCICARYFYDLSAHTNVYAVTQEDGKTKILLGLLRYDEPRFDTLLIIDELVDIVNISEYHRKNSKIYLFSSSEGVMFVFNSEGERVKLPHYIPEDAVGILDDYSIRHDGKTTIIHDKDKRGNMVTGYRCNDIKDKALWSNLKIFNQSKLPLSADTFRYHRTIEDVFIIPSNNPTIVMILSESIIHVKWVNKEGNVEFSEELLGEWSTAPFRIYNSIYAVDTNGILRDIRCAWINYKKSNVLPSVWNNINVDQDMLYSTELSLYDRDEEVNRYDMIFHGMIVFSRKRIKSAFSVPE